MTTLPGDPRALLEDVLLLEPEAARARWLAWRASVVTDDFDGRVVAHLPLLSARLAQWASDPQMQHPDQGRLAGISRQAWAKNQLALHELASLWQWLTQNGVTPHAFGGDAAWALVYQQEQAVRPIVSLELMVPRDQVHKAFALLTSRGWELWPGAPTLEGRALDHRSSVWLRGEGDRALHLVWRLPYIAPARQDEPDSQAERLPFPLHGVACFGLSPEELLLEALTRDRDGVVSWQCDAAILARNAELDWQRLQHRLHKLPSALARLRELERAGLVHPPASVFEPVPQNAFARRLASIEESSRNIAFRDGRPHTWLHLARYTLWRLGHGLVHRFDAHAATTVIDAGSSATGTTLAEYIRYRTFFVYLAMRDVRLRYRRTWRGILWALVQPLLPMLIFAAIFATVLRPALNHVPYWLFVLSGLAPWNFFANAVNYASLTFVSNLNLVNKVYFPRAILPLAAVAACGMDLAVATAALLPLVYLEGSRPGLRLLLLPLAMLGAVVMGAVVGTAAASLNVLNRDLKPLIPFLTQVAMYAAPVLYPAALVPRLLRPLIWLDPMTAVVESFRAILFGSPLPWRGVALSAAALTAVLLATWLLFRSVEEDIAERV